MKYIFLDSETGGIGLDKSLLTLSLVFTDENIKIINELNLNLIPDDLIYRVTPEGMEVNKIDLCALNKVAVTYKKGGQMLYGFLQYCHSQGGGKEKIVPIGHGMSGDLDHIFDKLVSRNSWENFVSYRRLDTSVVAQYLKMIGYMPETVSGSLASLAEFFSIPVEQNALHSARGDVGLIIEAVKKMKNLKIIQS